MHLDPWIWYISVCVSCESFVFGGQKAAYDFMFFLNGEHTHLGWSSLWTSRVIRPVSTWCLMLIVFVARAMDLILLKSNLSLLCLPYEIPVLIVHPCLQPFALYIVPSHIRVRSKKWIHFKTNNTRHVWHTQRTKTHTHTQRKTKKHRGKYDFVPTQVANSRWNQQSSHGHEDWNEALQVRDFLAAMELVWWVVTHALLFWKMGAVFK